MTSANEAINFLTCKLNPDHDPIIPFLHTPTTEGLRLQILNDEESAWEISISFGITRLLLGFLPALYQSYKLKVKVISNEDGEVFEAYSLAVLEWELEQEEIARPFYIGASLNELAKNIITRLCDRNTINYEHSYS